MSKPYEYTGVVHHIGKTQVFPSGFAKRTIVLCEGPTAEYKDFAAFDFLKGKKIDGPALLDGIQLGSRATVKFYVRANESKKTPGSWFSSMQGVGIEAERLDAPSIPMKDDPQVEEPFDDDMPF